MAAARERLGERGTAERPSGPLPGLYRVTRAPNLGPRPHIRPCSARREVRLEGLRDLLERHDAPQAAVAVDRHQGTQAAQGLGAQQRLERRVGLHLALLARADDQLAHRAGVAAALRDL